MSAPFDWPAHVEPRSGQEQPPADAPYRMPVYLADVFFIRSPEERASAMVAVAACVGGELAVFAGAELEGLEREETELASQLQAVRIAQRDVFRTIQANELFVGTIDAIEQNARTAGFNDPVDIDGTLQARLGWDGRTVTRLALDNAVRMLAGRLDLLAAYRTGNEHAFQNPRSSAGHTHHFFVPLAPAETIERGEGIALLYPLLDPAVSAQADNAVLAMRVAYDLLIRLQEEMRERAAPPAVAARLLPVPSRPMLEDELVASGYDIRGDIARRVRSAAPGDQERLPFLENLLRAFDRKPGDDVLLAPQATPNDYAGIIDEILPLVSTPGDTRMHAALAARLRPAAPATAVPVARQAPSPAAPPPAVAPATPRRRSRSPQSFDADFAPIPGQARSEPEPTWEDDFAPPGLADAHDNEGQRDGPNDRSFASDFEPPTGKPEPSPER